jgi:starch-binding outer membrane protein, SusD/RagB family
MARTMSVALVSLGVLLGTAGCNDFLTGDKLSSNPNSPSSASTQQLFMGVQAGQFALQEGTIPMMICMWVQACGATGKRFVELAGRYNYGAASNVAANSTDWALIYDAGGLVDIRQVEAGARAAGDSTWLGIARIWEALTIGTTADQWGNIPYTQVATSSAPPPDAQFAVYDSVQSLLTRAIVALESGKGPGPGSADLVFQGDTAKWRAAAYTLKARYFMHTAESLGTPAYQNAINAAVKGIADNTGSGDFRAFHTAATQERNMWAQFQGTAFGADLEAGKALTDIMNGRNDPRLPAYFCKNTSGGYGGNDFNVTQPAAQISNFACTPPPLRFSGTFRVPYVSYGENELILAEACSKPGTTCTSPALTHLNNERAYVNTLYPATLPQVALPALSGITGTPLLDSIMTEKYVLMFQNIETIMDYRRTCIPAITPVTVGNTLGFKNVPAALFFPLTELTANTNLPDQGTQLATHNFRTPGDVHACTNDAAP